MFWRFGDVAEADLHSLLGFPQQSGRAWALLSAGFYIQVTTWDGQSMCMTCRRSIEDGVNEQIRDPRAAAILTDLLEKMNNGLFQEEYMETLVGRSFRKGRWTVYDAWVMGQLHGEILFGSPHALAVGGKKASAVELWNHARHRPGTRA